MAAFQVPQVVDNSDGWGPSAIPKHLQGVPYAPFGKGDKLGKAADWTASGYQRYRDRYAQQGGSNAVFSFFHADEEDSFHLVDSRPVRPQQFKPRRFQQRPQNRREPTAADEKDGTKQPVKAQPKKKQQWSYYQRRDTRQPVYSSSVEIRPEWTVHEQIPFTQLSKLNFKIGQPTDVVSCGSVASYDKSFDRITPKMDKSLIKTKKAFKNVTASEDPVIRKLAESSPAVAKVFATDSVLSALMTATRSVYSWDIVVNRVGDKLYLDKREGSTLDQYTVNETAPEPIPEDRDSINAIQQLSMEATHINQNFSQQVLDARSARHSLGEADPFSEKSGDVASMGYKYRSWKLSDGCNILVRCTINACVDMKGEKQLCTLKALNEFDPKVSMDWRKKLETQRGAVLATELKNNSNKMARWAAEALLADADLIKLGYVSRSMPKSNKSHVLLGTQLSKPKDLAQQMNLNMDNSWGVVRAVVDLCMKLGDGKYLLVKDPNKQLLRLYEVPENAFKTDYSEEPLVEAETVPLPAAPKAKVEED